MKKKQLVGIVGVPPLSVMQELGDPTIRIVDLDEPQGRIDLELASPFLPRVYCGILRTVIANSLSLKPDIIYIDTGAGKCDCAIHTATVLEDILPDTQIVRCKNQDSTDFGIPLCRTRMDLVEKMSAITSGVQDVTPSQDYLPCQATAGFWGVPPGTSHCSAFSLTPPISMAGHVVWKIRHLTI